MHLMMLHLPGSVFLQTASDRLCDTFTTPLRARVVCVPVVILAP